MPRRSFYSKRSSNSQPAEKNYVSTNGAGVTASFATVIDVADADNGSGDGDIAFPSTVKAVFVSASLAADTLSAADTFGVLMAKVPGGASGLSNPNGPLNNQTQSWTFLWLRMTPRTQNTAHTFIGWVKIPKRHQIFNEGDKLVWSMSSGPTSTYSHCSNFVYKYRA